MNQWKIETQGDRVNQNKILKKETSMFICENHLNRKARWLRNSWVLSGTPAPICDECKRHYEELNLSKALNVRAIFMETKNERHEIHAV